MIKHVQINGYPYEVNISGSGQPTWVFLHGFLGSQQEFSAIRPTGTRIMLTLKGFGAQAPNVTVADLTVDQQVTELKLLFDALALGPVHLVGYSMGARLALSYALRYPETVAQLVLESGTAGLATQTERLARQAKDEALAQSIMQDGMRAFVDRWERLPLFATQQHVALTDQQNVRAQRLNQVPLNMAASLRAFGTGEMPNYWQIVAGLAVPTTIITGGCDSKFTTIGRALHEKIENSEQRIVPAVGHNVHLEAPASYTGLLNQLV